MNPTFPWLSVVMPVFNGAATLGESLDSLLAQGDGIEIVLVDQGSTDGSLAIAEAYSDRLPLTILSAPENENWVQNTNLGLRKATAPVVTMLHQDDLWRPGRGVLVKSMVERHPDAVIWAHASDYVDSAGTKIGRISAKLSRETTLIARDEALRRLIVQNTLALPGVAFKRDLALELGGLDQALWYTADWDFWLRLLARGALSWSPEAAAGFRLHPASQTVTRSSDLRDFEQQLEIPLRRHLSSLPAAERARAGKRAEASNAVNLWLAARHHGAPLPFLPVLWQVLRLGPWNWPSFLRDTQIVARVLPRLRLRW